MTHIFWVSPMIRFFGFLVVVKVGQVSQRLLGFCRDRGPAYCLNCRCFENWFFRIYLFILEFIFWDVLQLSAQVLMSWNVWDCWDCWVVLFLVDIFQVSELWMGRWFAVDI